MKPVQRVRAKLRTEHAVRDAGSQPPAAPVSETATTQETLRQVAQLRQRVEELESEVQENRRLNRRLAELTDVVQELLVPIAQRDEDKLRERLEKYAESL